MSRVKKKSSSKKASRRKLYYNNEKKKLVKKRASNRSKPELIKMLKDKERLRIKRRNDPQFKEEDNKRRKIKLEEKRKDPIFKKEDNERIKSLLEEKRKDPIFKKEDNERRKSLLEEKRKDPIFKKKDNERTKSLLEEKRKDPQFKEEENEQRKERHKKNRYDLNKMESERERKRLLLCVLREDDKYCNWNKIQNRAFKKAVRLHTEYSYRKNYEAELFSRKENGDEYARAQLKYLDNIKQGPDWICKCCEGLWFSRSVVQFDETKIENLLESRFGKKGLKDFMDKIINYQDSNYICKTCLGYICKGTVPKMATSWGMKFPEVPDCIANLNKLEERMVTPFINFMQIRPLMRFSLNPQLQMKGSVVNIMVEMCDMLQVLPRTFDEMATIQVKLKRHIDHKSDYKFETIRPSVICKALEYLVDTPLYKKYKIIVNQEYLERFQKNDDNFTLPFVIDVEDKNDAIEELETEKILPCPKEGEETKCDESECDSDFFDDDDEVLVMDANKDVLNDKYSIRIIAPGQDQSPVAWHKFSDLDELCFPRKFAGQQITTHEKLSYSDRAKSEARRKDRRCCSPERILYMAKLKQEKAVSSSLNICMRKGKQTNVITAKDVLNKSFIKDTLASDAGFQVLRNIRSAPSYWEKRKAELLSMVRQMGHPTFFLTVSSAESSWNELLRSLYLAKNDKLLSDKELLDMDQFTKTQLIREDPVTCARYFDYKVGNFMKLLKCPQGPLGDNWVEDSYEKVEFQQRGSPHEHMFLWCHNAPVYGKDPIDECIHFINKHITCKYDENNPLLSMQRHMHTHTCYKGNKNKKVCRFHYPIPVMPRTMILEPLEEDKRTDKIKEHSEKIKNKMYGFYMKSTDVSFETILDDLEMSEEDYITAIRSQIDRVRVFLERDSLSVSINSYNKHLLILFNSNIDIQFVLDPYSCASYIVNYITKIEAGLSKLLKTAAADAKVKGLGIREKLRKISNVFLNANLMSAQEAGYHVLGLPLSKCSRASIFVNTCPREERIRMLKAPKHLINIPEDCVEIFVSNITDKYAIRDRSREIECLADFATAYRPKNSETGFQGSESEESDDEEPKEDLFVKIPARRKILRYRHYKIEQDEYNFYREQILLFLPWRYEGKEVENIDCKAVYLGNVDTINDNCSKYNVISEEQMAKALQFAQTNAVDREEAEYKEVVDDVIPTGMEVDIDVQTGKPGGGGTSKDIKMRIATPSKIEWEQTLGLLRMLNNGQREIVMHVFSQLKKNNEPLRLFISGAAGVGKSLVINILFQLLTNYYDKRPGVKTDTPKVLLTAPSGKAAHLISGVTLHTAFALPVTKFGGIMPALSENVANSLRCKLIDLKLLIIDEISMVGSRTLSRVDTRLRQIMGKKYTFGGVSVIVVGDLHQLPPVMDKPVFEPPYVNELSIFQDQNPLWEEFTLYELNEIMRQKGEKEFILVLNQIAQNIELTDNELSILNSRKVPPHSVPDSAVRLYSKNYLVDKYNNQKLKSHPGEQVVSIAEDIILGKQLTKKQENDIRKSIKNRQLCDLQGLPNEVIFKLGIKYMITFNIQVDQGLVNGACGVLRHVTSVGESVKIVWIEFSEDRIGMNLKIQYANYMKEHGIPNNLVPLKRLTSPLTSNPNHVYQIFRKQFPLVPAEALTIHKSQGQSYEEICVDFKSIDRANRQLLYVALSRVKSLEGLYILGDVEKKLFRSGISKDCDEIERLRKYKSLNLCYDNLEGKQGLTFIYHNVNSLQKHLIDIEKDSWYSRGDVIIFAETCLKKTPPQSIKIGNANFSTAHFSERIDKTHQRGLLLLVKPNLLHEIRVLKYLSKCEIEIHKKGVEIILFSVKNYFVLSGYKNPACSSLFFFKCLKEIIKELNFASNIVVIGDFNFDVLRPNPLENKLGKYKLTSALRKDISTTDYNTQIDIIFTNLHNFKCSSGIYDSYFSDHKAIFINVTSELISNFEDMEIDNNDECLNNKHSNQDGHLFAVPPTTPSKRSIVSVSDVSSTMSVMSISDVSDVDVTLLNKTPGLAKDIQDMNTKIDAFEFSPHIPLFSFSNNGTILNIYKHDLVTLKTHVSEEETTLIRNNGISHFHPKWLTDNIIDCYLYRLSENCLHFSFGDTAVCQLLTSTNITPDSVIKDYITRNLPLRGKTHIALPFNTGGNHWEIALLRLDDKTYVILDPMSEKVSKYVETAVTRFVNNLIENKDIEHDFQAVQTTKKSHQSDNYNCGVFICWYAMRFAYYQEMFDDRFDPNEFRIEIFNELIPH